MPVIPEILSEIGYGDSPWASLVYIEAKTDSVSNKVDGEDQQGYPMLCTCSLRMEETL